MGKKGQHLAKKDVNGNIVGMWEVMSDLTHSFKPWDDNFRKGLYLAGVECTENAQAPADWTKWTVPGYEYIYVECENLDTFPEVIKYMNDNDIPLVGAVHDFTCLQTEKNICIFLLENYSGKLCFHGKVFLPFMLFILPQK